MTSSKQDVMYHFEKYFHSLKDLKEEKSLAPISPNKAAGACNDFMEKSFCDEFQDLLNINTELVKETNKEIKERNSHLREKQTQLKNKKILRLSKNIYRAVEGNLKLNIDKEGVIDSFFCEIGELYETLSSMEQDFREQKKEKADIDRSGSTWDYKTFHSYAQDLLERNCQFEFDSGRVPVQQNVDKIVQNIRERFQECGRVLSGDTSPPSTSLIPKNILKPLQKYRMREESVRAFLNIMLFPIFDKVKVKVLLEEKLHTEDMPTNVCDYILVDKSGKTIGVIEAKDRGKLNDVSVIQCLLQMLSLQKLTGFSSNLFGIVTDAYHFVFLYLQGRTITLYCKKNYECYILKNDSWKDMEVIIVNVLRFCSGFRSLVVNDLRSKTT